MSLIRSWASSMQSLRTHLEGFPGSLPRTPERAARSPAAMPSRLQPWYPSIQLLGPGASNSPTTARKIGVGSGLPSSLGSLGAVGSFLNFAIAYRSSARDAVRPLTLGIITAMAHITITSGGMRSFLREVLVEE